MTCTNKSVLSKLDALGKHFDKPPESAKQAILIDNVIEKALQEKASASAFNPQLCSGDYQKKQTARMAKNALLEHQTNSHPGFSVAFDNIDLEIHRRNMTMANQNKDIHWINHKMFQNRVSGNTLSKQSPRKNLADVSNMAFLPSANDQSKQRYNYIVLVSRMLVEYFKAFEPLKDVCIQQIPHKYTKEMSERSVKVTCYPICRVCQLGVLVLHV